MRNLSAPKARLHRARQLVVGFILCLSGGVAQADASLDGLLQRIAAHGGGRVTFVERQYLSVLKQPVELTGELYFVPPDHLEKRVLTPKPESMVIDKGTLTMERGGRKRSVPLASHPEIGVFIESIRATLAGDRAALEAVYTLDFSWDGRGWTLALRPKDARLARNLSVIRIAGHDDLVETFEIVRVDGDRSVMNVTVPAGG
jgi:hypothetical protein